MKGLTIAEEYYKQYGAPMLHEEFPELEGIVAVGLCGSGSECMGYDDELSKDHDFEPGFLIFLPPEEVVDRRLAFRLERAYDKLPNEFMTSPSIRAGTAWSERRTFLSPKWATPTGR